MNHYEIWCNLIETHRDLEFVQAVEAYFGLLKREGLIADWRLTRRKLGFGPPELGEFHVSVLTENLAQLDRAWALAATRRGDVEKLHREVYSRIKDFRAALYRDFPDPQRKDESATRP